MALSRREQSFEQRFRRRLTDWARESPGPGVTVCVLLTALAAWLHSLPFPPFTTSGGLHPLSAVLLALLLGMLVGNLYPAPQHLKPGADTMVKKLLPIGIILLGAGLDFFDLVQVGLRAVGAAVITITVAILLTQLLARVMRVGGKLGLLIGVGTAICGTSAIVATAPVIEADDEDMVFSIGAINLFGVLAMLTFPLLGAALQIPAASFGVWCGLAIHATPQVIAAGFAHFADGQRAGEIATIVKLTRVSLLGPVVFIIGAIYAYQRRKHDVYIGRPTPLRKLIPSFVLLFLAMACLRTMGFFPEITLHMTDRFIFGAGDRTFDLARLLAHSAKWIIIGAMAGVGLGTELRAMKSVGFKAFTLGLLAASILAVLGWSLAGQVGATLGG